MTKDVISFKPDDSLASVAKTFIEKKISAGPVVDEENRVVGVISESDLMEVLEYHEGLLNELFWSWKKAFEDLDKWVHRVENGKVKDEMSKDVITVHLEDEVSKAAEAMVLKKVNHIPVVGDEDKLVGIVARADVIRAMVEEV